MSEIKVDTLTGKTSAGDITVTSEGGAATQSLQQGLAKSWVNFNGQNTVLVRDSFGITSIQDIGTGQYRLNFTNAYASTGYATTQTAGQSGPNGRQSYTIYNYTTTSVDPQIVDMGGSYTDPEFVNSITTGGLA